jgi:reticulon-4-interacting protein 1, mitochondrial
MMSATELLCIAPSETPQLHLQPCEAPRMGGHEVLVRVHATSVNPIDVKRAAGYGRRLLGLKGAARFPLVLGNDFAGEVLAVGKHAARWRVGQRVLGALPTGPRGAHSSHVAVHLALMCELPLGHDFASACVLPYSFTTVWRAFRSIGLGPDTAAGQSVLVHGASGGLGLIALQLLSRWGARVTAVCSARHFDMCGQMGAHDFIDRLGAGLRQAPAKQHASLNFGSWDDDAAVMRCLAPSAIGHATAVHPLLASFDALGWVGGARHAIGAWHAHRRMLRAQSPQAKLSWTVYQPDADAIEALGALMHQDPIGLPVGLNVPLARGAQAFDHVAQQLPGRAVMNPGLSERK